MRSHNFVGSDLHCGHIVGLAPNEYNLGEDKFSAVRRELWAVFLDWLKKYGPYDNIFLLGDLIDGSGIRSGGSELITTDRLQQVEIAVRCIESIPLKKGGKRFIVRGTPYHVGECEEFEDVIADKLAQCRVEDHGYFDIDGCMLDMKHHVGSSSIPHGRSTPVKRDYMWSTQWAIEHGFPIPNVLIRGHVHYYDSTGGPSWTGCTLPALCGLGSRFGKKRCSGVVHFGYVDLDIVDGVPSITPHIALGTQKPEVVKV